MALVVASALFIAALFMAQPSGGRQIDFRTSGSREARESFLEGVAILHSFGYERARVLFRRSTEIDPNFAMGYWGEAMTHNHPVWGDPQDIKAGRTAIDKAKHVVALTTRERAYVEAVKALFGEGDKKSRDHAYLHAMAELHGKYPDDDEAALFYALALLGAAGHGEEGLPQRMQAAALAQDVQLRKPQHPGAIHYTIHAFDDPEHAILALPAARQYAQTAPTEAHALHMPSHIFVQLGMWPEAASSNEAAWKASEKHPHGGMKDFHSLQWLHYVYLQQGRYADAENLLAGMVASLGQPARDSFQQMYLLFTYSSMAAAQVIETERWEQAEAFASRLRAALPAKRDAKMEQFAAYIQAPVAFAVAMGAAKSGAAAQEAAAILRKVSQAPAVPYEALHDLPKVATMQQLEIAAVQHAAGGRIEQAVDSMKKAVEVQKGIGSGPLGPPLEIKPVHEVFGEILLATGRASEASMEFGASLRRHPNRARSRLGYAHASKQAGGKRP